MINLGPLSVLAILFIVFALTGIIAEQLHTSPILFFIGFGMVLGPYGIGLIQESRELEFLKQIGLILLLFIAGLDFDVEKLEGKLIDAIIIGIPPAIVGFSLAFILSLLTDWFNLFETIILAVILTTTSISLSLSVLREKLSANAGVYQTLVLSVILSNIIMILVSTFTARIFSADQFKFWTVFGQFFLVIGFITFVVFLSSNVHHIWKQKYAQADKKHTEQERKKNTNIRMRFALGLLGMILLIAFFLNITPAIAAFIGGIYVNRTTNMTTSDISKMNTLGYGLMIPIFFIAMGMGINISHLTNPDMILKISVILLISFTGQVILTTLSSLLVDFKVKESIYLGIGLSACSLSGGFAILSITNSSGIISPTSYTIFATTISVSVLMTIIGMEIFEKILEYRGEYETVHETGLISGAENIEG